MTVRKRFTAFCITGGLLTFGALFVDPAIFVTFAQMISAGFVVYVGGQSATDYAQAKKNGV